MKYTKAPMNIEKQYEELTPQGSEFANSPQNVYEYIKWRLDNEGKAMKKNVKLKRINTELLEALKNIHSLWFGKNIHIHHYRLAIQDITKQAIAKVEGEK